MDKLYPKHEMELREREIALTGDVNKVVSAGADS